MRTPLRSAARQRPIKHLHRCGPDWLAVAMVAVAALGDVAV
jgi:hypothetical protein